MNCNVHVLYKIIFSNKFGFILETVFSYYSHFRFRCCTLPENVKPAVCTKKVLYDSKLCFSL